MMRSLQNVFLKRSPGCIVSESSELTPPAWRVYGRWAPSCGLNSPPSHLSIAVQATERSCALAPAPSRQPARSVDARPHRCPRAARRPAPHRAGPPLLLQTLILAACHHGDRSGGRGGCGWGVDAPATLRRSPRAAAPGPRRAAPPRGCAPPMGGHNLPAACQGREARSGCGRGTLPQPPAAARARWRRHEERRLRVGVTRPNAHHRRPPPPSPPLLAPPKHPPKLRSRLLTAPRSWTRSPRTARPAARRRAAAPGRGGSGRGGAAATAS